MKNPLNKRLPRELKSEFGKYLVIFLFYVIAISMVSGFLVADNSLINAYDESFEKYSIEDGNFEYYEKAENAVLEEIEKEGVTVYENFYKEEETEDFESTLRIFGERKEVDRVCLMDGEMPAADDEIAIDRLYALNHKLEIGDSITAGEYTMKISGIVALSDYSALFQNSSDLMFDNDKFGVGVMTDAGFETVRDNHIHYSYSWVYDNKPEDDIEAKEMSEDLMSVLSQYGVLTNFLPEYCNQAIVFTGEDMGGDKAMISAFLYIVVIILAFVFSITVGNTILKEATVIGTLRASGYSRGELVRHYMIVPMLVLLVAAVIGNVLGYTVFEKVFSNTYYGSYSLPTYEVLINAEAFILTTVIPMIIMFVILIITLTSKLRLSPLRFIRRDLSKRGKKKAFRLNTKIKIMTRFRLRVIFQNISNYVTVFVGVFFANFILMFGFVFPPMLDKFEDDITSNVLAEYQYVLKAPAETSSDNAEKFVLGSLSTTYENRKSETVSVYGISSDSKYVELTADKNKIDISTAYRDKYGVDIGDTITLKENYGDKEYEFTVGGYYDYPATIAVFMDKEFFNETFEYEADYFNAYFSDEEITDIDDMYIATKITEDDLTKTSRQLMRSMGSMMYLFTFFGVIMFMLIIFLLAKIIIEKNSQSISMTKILGYNHKEINSLYIHSTTIVTLLSIILTLPLCNAILKYVCIAVFSDYSGWLAYYMPPSTYLKVAIMGVVSYAVVAFLLMKKVRKIPMSDALKNVE